LLKSFSMSELQTVLRKFLTSCQIINSQKQKPADKPISAFYTLYAQSPIYIERMTS
jgi:hypothetical protein